MFNWLQLNIFMSEISDEDLKLCMRKLWPHIKQMCLNPFLVFFLNMETLRQTLDRCRNDGLANNYLSYKFRHKN